MERSSDRSCRQRLGEDTGQVHSRRAGVFSAISTGTWWSSLLPGGGARPPTSAWGPGSQDAPGRGLQSTSSSSKADVGLHRRGVALRTASEPGRKKPAKKNQSKAKEEGDRKQRIQQWQQQSGCDRHRPHVGTAQKELAQQWHAKESRKEKVRSSSKRRGQRFSLLSKKKEDSEGEPESKLEVTTSLIEAAVKAEDPLRGFLALQLAQVAKPRKKKGKKSRDRWRSRSTDSSRSPSGTSDSGSSSSDQQGKKVTPERWRDIMPPRRWCFDTLSATSSGMWDKWRWS